MVYQEDVMKIVHHFAGLDLDESGCVAAYHDGQKEESSDTFRNLIAREIFSQLQRARL
jgi:hypothetical protein